MSDSKFTYLSLLRHCNNPKCCLVFWFSWPNAFTIGHLALFSRQLHLRPVAASRPTEATVNYVSTCLTNYHAMQRPLIAFSDETLQLPSARKMRTQLPAKTSLWQHMPRPKCLESRCQSEKIRTQLPVAYLTPSAWNQAACDMWHAVARAGSSCPDIAALTFTNPANESAHDALPGLRLVPVCSSMGAVSAASFFTVQTLRTNGQV